MTEPLSRTPAEATQELVYPQILDEAARHCSHLPAFTDQHQALCICAVRERADRVASALDELVPTDAPFAVLARNNVDYAVLWLVALTGRRVITPLNARLAVPELEHVLRDSEAAVLIAEDAFWDTARTLAERLPGLRLVPFADRPDAGASLAAIAAHGRPSHGSRPAEEDVVTIMYTGGTTGKPKGVVLTQRAMMLGLYRHAMAYDSFTARDRWLTTTPMFHASSFAGLFCIPVARGQVFVPEGFTPDTFIENVERHRITGCVLVPTMMQLVVDSPAYRPERLRSLRLIGYGGSPIPTDLLTRLLSDLPDCDLRQIYGSTEVGGVATLLGSAEHREGGPALRSVGRALPGVRIEVQNAEGRALEPGGVGEICLRTGSLMSGYHRAPELTADAFRNGWYCSGDLGYLDDSGHLFVVDRLKDMIVTGGENVYSAEVENVLAAHPGIAQVAVIGVPHRVWGEAVHAIVVPTGDLELTSAEVIAHARERLAGYKTPKSVEFRSDLPVSAANKVLKHVLRQEAAAAGVGTHTDTEGTDR